MNPMHREKKTAATPKRLHLSSLKFGTAAAAGFPLSAISTAAWMPWAGRSPKVFTAPAAADRGVFHLADVVAVGEIEVYPRLNDSFG